MALIWVNPGDKAEKVMWELPDEVSASARWDIFDAMAEPAARRQQIVAGGRRLELEIEPRTGLFLVLRPGK